MTATAAAGDVSLKRAISGNLLLLLVVGDVLGAGIYALVGKVGERVGGAIWVAFLVALALAMFTASAYAELVTKYPQAAGAALYVNKAWRRPLFTFLVAFTVMSSGLTSAATLARAFGGDYLSVFLDVPAVPAALVFILVVALVNFRGIAESVRLNVVLTSIELIGLVLVVVVGLAAIGQSGSGVDAGRVLDFKGGESVVLAIAGGTGLAFFSLIGFEDSVNLAEEARDPTRDYPRALFGGLLIAGAVYLLVTVVASMAVPTDRLAG
jgi:basic amino acid/polyamine antiporter, APA family